MWAPLSQGRFVQFACELLLAIVNVIRQIGCMTCLRVDPPMVWNHLSTHLERSLNTPSYSNLAIFHWRAHLRDCPMHCPLTGGQCFRHKFVLCTWLSWCLFFGGGMFWVIAARAVHASSLPQSWACTGLVPVTSIDAAASSAKSVILPRCNVSTTIRLPCHFTIYVCHPVQRKLPQHIYPNHFDVNTTTKQNRFSTPFLTCPRF